MRILALTGALVGLFTGLGVVAGNVDAGWAPFFDEDRTVFGFLGVDITPQPPKLDALDEKVLNLCGEFGSRPAREDFIRLVEQAQREVRLLERIYADLELQKAGIEPAAFRQKFIDIWTKREGFQHIFCGELSRKGLGGLHYVGRYYQLERQGKIGLAVDKLERCVPEVEEGLVYTVPVKYKKRDGQTETDCRTGYGYELNAYRMFLQGTRAYLSSQEYVADKSRYVCRYTVNSASGAKYWTALVIQEGAIRTFFTIKRNQRTKDRFANPCNEESRADDRL